jgi:hypothetical protein
MKSAGGGSSSGGDGTAGSITGTGDGGATVPDSMNKLAIKAEYMAARQAWIRAGKKGDPPPRPEGID